MTLPDVLALRSTTRAYAWGSPDTIPALLGEPATGEPVAELWVGAHPAQPSVWAGPDGTIGLDTLIADDPEALLGATVAARFGGRLPFLLKLIAARQALSLQAHPDLDQARDGFARENAAGVPLGARERNYQDDNHKPELLCALEPTEALCSFRPVAQSLDLFAALDAPQLAPLVALLQEATDLRAATDLLLGLDPVTAAAWTADAAARADALLADRPDHPWAGELGWLVRLAAQAPDEIGPVVALLLNLVRLAPGEAVFLAAGQLHTYLAGFGVEVLANSDNVLRGGLTPKHVDRAELLHVATFDPVDPSFVPDLVSPARTDYPVPVEDFLLSTLSLTAGAEPLAVGSPGQVLLLATAGEVVLCGGDGVEVVLGAGRGAFLPAGRTVTAAGDGLVFRAAVGGHLLD